LSASPQEQEAGSGEITCEIAASGRRKAFPYWKTVGVRRWIVAGKGEGDCNN